MAAPPDTWEPRSKAWPGRALRAPGPVALGPTLSFGFTPGKWHQHSPLQFLSTGEGESGPGGRVGWAPWEDRRPCMAHVLAGGRDVPPLRAAQGRVLTAVLGEGRLGARDGRESPASASPAIGSVRILLKHKEASSPSRWSGGCPAWPLGSLPLGSCPGLGSPSVHGSAALRGPGTRKPPIRGRGLCPQPRCFLPRAPRPLRL